MLFPKGLHMNVTKSHPIICFLSVFRFCLGNVAEISIGNKYLYKQFQKKVFCLISCIRIVTNQGLQTKVQQYYII